MPIQLTVAEERILGCVAQLCKATIQRAIQMPRVREDSNQGKTTRERQYIASRRSSPSTANEGFAQNIIGSWKHTPLG